MNISRRYLDDAFTVGVLVVATGACQTLVTDSSSAKAGVEGTPVLQAIWACIYIIVAIRASSRYRAILDTIRANKLLIALVLLAVVSAVWSEDRGLTLRRSMALVATTLFGLDFAVRYSIREQLRLLAIALGLVIAVSVLLQVFAPGLIPTFDVAYPDAWVGAFGQKNVFSKIVVLEAIVMLALLRLSPSGILTGILALLGALGLIIAAESMTAFVVLLAMIAILVFSPTLRWNKGIRIILQGFAGVGILPALYLIIRHRDTFTELLGRNSSLTGRVKIWTMAMAAIAMKPILGYGYNAFWNVSPESMRIDVALNWMVPHAHNAYIEMALELGLVGLVLCALTYLVALWRASEYMRFDGSNAAKWPLVYLCFVLMYSFTESMVMAPNTIYWMLFVAAACSVTQPQEVEDFSTAEEGEPDSDEEGAEGLTTAGDYA
jgi:exopolysaccharide production protein ExoQ